MAHIKLTNCALEIPIKARLQGSLRNQVIQSLVGAAIERKNKNTAVVRALVDISLSLKEGDRVGVLGANGAGKSSLLRLLAGIYEPTSGHAERSGKIATLFDLSLGMDVDSSGRDNIRLMAIYRGINLKTIRKYEDEIVSFSELGSFIDLPVRTYSSGMILRLAFSLSVIIESDILIMDEWLAVGDAAFSKKAEQELQTLVNNASIFVIATHDPALVNRLCNKVICMENGNIVSFSHTNEQIDEKVPTTSQKSVQKASDGV